MTRRRSFEFHLDGHSGVPVYRQIIDQVMAGIAAGALTSGDQMPTVRQVAVDLSINPNTVMRAYRELKIRGVFDTQQGAATFNAPQQVRQDEVERRQLLNQLIDEFVARAGSGGFTVDELLEQLHDRATGSQTKRR